MSTTFEDITQDVLAREDIVRYIKDSPGELGIETRERVEAYLEELRTTQRYSIYRTLKHPLYPLSLIHI